MPQKLLYPTIYPPQTKASAIQAFASIIARSAVRIAQHEDLQSVVEPEIEHSHVYKDTSIKAGIIELCLIPKETQPSLFGEVDS